MAGAGRRYDRETQERAVRLYRDRRRENPAESALASRRRVGELVDVKPETLRGWVERAEIEAGTREGTTTDENAEIARLKKENSELRRANEILKTASAFFAAAELDRKLS
jgi:transposase-like protein